MLAFKVLDISKLWPELPQFLEILTVVKPLANTSVFKASRPLDISKLWLVKSGHVVSKHHVFGELC